MGVGLALTDVETAESAFFNFGLSGLVSLLGGRVVVFDLGLDEGLCVGLDVFDWAPLAAALLAEYGSAVAGRGISGLRVTPRGRFGLIGAEEREPVCEEDILETELNGRAEADAVNPGRCAVVDGAFDSESTDCADSGLGGKSLPARRARFWAAIVSLSDGRPGTAVVLFEKLGRAAGASIGADSTFGLEGCFSSSCLYLLSREHIMLVLGSVKS